MRPGVLARGVLASARALWHTSGRCTRNAMKKTDSSLGLAWEERPPEGGGSPRLAWARAQKGRDKPALTGAGAEPPRAADPATLALPTADLALRVESFPSSDPEEIALLASNLMETDAPLDPSEMVFAHEILSTGEGTSLVLCAAAPVAAVEALRAAAGIDAGRVARVDAAALGAVRALASSPEAAAEGRQPVLFEEGGRATLLLLEDRKPVAVRSVCALRAATPAALSAAVRLALAQAEIARGPSLSAPLLFRGASLRDAAKAAAAATGREAKELAPQALSPVALAFGAAARTAEGASGFNLFPAAWTEALDNRRWARTFCLSVAGGAVLWALLALFLFGYPAILGARADSLRAEVAANQAAEDEVRQFRDRIAIVDRYADRTYSALEVLREVALALPDDVTLAKFNYDAARHEASVEGASNSSAPAYEFSNRMKASPLFLRTSIVNGPTVNRSTGKTAYTIRLELASATNDAARAAGGGAR